MGDGRVSKHPELERKTLQYYVLSIKAQPLVEKAHTWQCTPDTWTNLCEWTYKHTCTSLKSSQLEGLHVGGLLYMAS